MIARTDIEGYDHHKGAAPLLRPARALRTGAFLALNLAAFIEVHAFWLYLSTGRWMRLAAPAAGEATSGLFRYPLDVFTHPWMVVVWGVLLAVVVMVPVSVSVLYRLLFAGLFVGVVAAFGLVLLWVFPPGAVVALSIAMALAVGCVLAARTPLRSDMPFLAALLGLAPVGLCFFLFVAFGSEAALPMQRWILMLPYLIAFVAAVLGEAAILALVRLTRFRPGVIWPVLAVLVAAPILVFFVRIGPGELDYALIARSPGLNRDPGDAIFEEISLQTWRREHKVDDDNRFPPLEVARLVRAGMDERKDALMDRCARFLEQHPDSRRAPAILWLQSQCASLQLDGPAYAAGLVKYTAAHPAPSEPGDLPSRKWERIAACREAWQRMLDRYGDSGQAALANWRLAELALRRVSFERAAAGEVADLLAEADRRLHEAAERLRDLAAPLGAPDAAENPGAVFAPAESVPSRQYYAKALFEASRLIWLMKENDVLNDRRSARALADYLNANPHELSYRERIGDLLGDPGKGYEATKMGDNLKLAHALRDPNVYERAETLIVLAATADVDVQVEANFELGLLRLRAGQAPALPLIRGLESAEVYFRRVADEAPPDNPWRQRAQEHLASLRTATAPSAR